VHEVFLEAMTNRWSQRSSSDELAGASMRRRDVIKNVAATMAYALFSDSGKQSSTMRNFAALQHKIISHHEI
jgi:hypothetical protein